MKNLIVMLSFLLPLSAYAFPEWLELTDQQNKICAATNPCHITQNKSKTRFDIVFALTKEGKKLTLAAVQIGPSGKPKQIYKDLFNYQRHYEDEKFGVYAVDLNSDGYLDLALDASYAPRLGTFYFYFLFNPKTESFVMTPKQVERLNLQEKGELVSAGSMQHYKIDANYHLVVK